MKIGRRELLVGGLKILMLAPLVARLPQPPTYPAMLQTSDGSWEAPNGETITRLQSFGGRLLVFTPSAIYEVDPREMPQQSAEIW